MKKIAWATDIHLDRLSERDYREYKEYLEELSPDCLLISGDIAEGEFVCRALRDFDETFNFPIYFVLGNHDFYYGSFAETEENVRRLVDESRNLHWLTRTGIVRINETTALIGVESWGDGRNGTLDLSEATTRDVFSIADYKGLNREEIKELLHLKGDHYAALLRPVLIEACEKYRNVVLVTHVPPFTEVCFDRSLRICSPYQMPFYSCRAVGDLLLSAMREHPENRLTVLCGHTHEKADLQIRDNLRVRVKESGYGSWWEATMLEFEG